MAASRLPGTAVRVRRGRRADFAQVQAVLGAGAGGRAERFYRRMLADLGVDLYVAEDGAGAIVGLVSVAYVRSLAAGGAAAVLDTARVSVAPAAPLLDGLVAFAEARARRRGCRRLDVRVDAGDAELRATLLGRGYGPGETLGATLLGPA